MTMLTREQIMELSGRGLDAEVARERGWTDIRGGQNCVTRKWSYWGHPPGSRTRYSHASEVRFFHADIAAAWELVEELISEGYWTKLLSNYEPEEIHQFMIGEKARPRGWGWSPCDYDARATIAPTAISRAYLLAKMEGDDG